MPATHFQVNLSGSWKDYQGNEDKILKRAFLAGFPNCKYQLRKQRYEVNFKEMQQLNVETGKKRSIRPPHRWKAPAKPICKAGPTFCIQVPEGAAGTTIHVPHPKAKGQFIAVEVPASAKAGQAMMVPVPEASPVAPESPPEPEVPAPSAPPAADAADAPAEAATEKKAGRSAAAKVAMGVGGVAAVGGLAVAGAVLGEHIAEEGWDATMAELGSAAADVGEGIADGAEAAVDWVGDAADTAGDFIMDLF
jgi:hypothetical protein